MGRRKNTLYVPLKQASAIAQLEKITSRSQYQKWWDTWQPNELPRAPWRVYKDWAGWSTFLGTDNKFKNSEPHRFKSYKDALVYASTTQISTSGEWMEFKHPHDIPVRPDIVYRGHFKGWRHFLQTGVKKVEAIVEVAKRIEETQLLLFSQPDTAVPNQVHISVFPNVEVAKKFMNSRRYTFVKAFKLVLGYDWQLVVNAHATDYGNNEWMVHNLNELLFDIDLEWVR